MSLDSPKTYKKQMIDDFMLDAVGGATLKILDKHQLLNDKSKIATTSYAQLRQWGISHDIIHKCKAVAGPTQGFQTAAKYFEDTEKFEQIKFNVQSLDELTEGGIDVGSVTEIFGEAGVGKTQLCLQLALNIQLPKALNGSGAKSVYISTDKRVAISRMKAMEEGLRMKFFDHEDVQDMDFMENVFVQECASSTYLQFLVNEELPALFTEHPDIKIFIIDSIAGIFRSETNYIKRASQMRQLVHELERLSRIYNFAIVTTNHITSVPQGDGIGLEIASLGLNWDSLISTKIKIEKSARIRKSEDDEFLQVRKAMVIYSPRLPCDDEAKFIINAFGIKSHQ